MGHSIDREKVIAALHCRAYDDDFLCWKCAYYKQDEKPVARCDYRGLMDDAIALLKEQEAVEPRVSTAEQRCGHCNKVIEMDGWQSCPWCGKRIDWKGWWKKNGTRNQDT